MEITNVFMVLYWLFALTFMSIMLASRSDVPIWLKLIILVCSPIACPIILGDWLANKVLEG